jgi:AcrR family transcriptional regulator
VSDSATPDRRSRRRERTRTAILDAAERLFLNQGYQATTVERLAEEADVAVGSLYAHFGGKGGVYAALIDRALELDAHYADLGEGGASDPLGRLVGLADGYLRFAREHPGYFRLFRFPPDGVPTDGPAAAAAARVAAWVDSEVARMAEALREAMATGIVRPLDPERTARVLWTAWDAVIAAQVLPGGMGLSDEEFDGLLDLIGEILTRGLLNTGEAQP